MKTDDLIDALAAGLEPAKPAMPSPVLLAAAATTASRAKTAGRGSTPGRPSRIASQIPVPARAAV